VKACWAGRRRRIEILVRKKRSAVEPQRLIVLIEGRDRGWDEFISPCDTVTPPFATCCISRARDISNPDVHFQSL